MEESNQIEQNKIYEELEKISKTYKIYAESHKKLQKLSENKIQESLNKNLLEQYQDHFCLFLIDYISLFHEVISNLTKPKKELQSLNSIKNTLLNNITKYKLIIDNYNFPEISSEFISIISNSKKYQNIKPESDIKGYHNSNNSYNQIHHHEYSNKIRNSSPLSSKPSNHHTNATNRSKDKADKSKEKQGNNNSAISNRDQNFNLFGANDKNYKEFPKKVESISNINKKDNIIISKDYNTFNFLDKSTRIHGLTPEENVSSLKVINKQNKIIENNDHIERIQEEEYEKEEVRVFVTEDYFAKDVYLLFRKNI